MEYLTNYWVVSLHFCCNDIFVKIWTIHIKMTLIRSVGDEIRENGGGN